MTWLRIAAVAAAPIYPILLLCTAAALHFVGERWWVTTVALYLPRIALAAPLPFVVFGLLACGRGRWLWTQSVSVVLILFPLMGLVVPVPRLGGGKAPTVRVLSYNINSALGGVSKVVEEIDRFSPDVVLLQEIAQSEELKRVLRSRYPTVEVSGQFLVATRFAIVSTSDPERLPFDGRERSPRFLEYVLDTPLDRIAIYSVHPISPREDFHALRGRGLRREILSGHLFSGDSGPSIVANARLRALQVEAIAGAATRNLEPVVIAGDTNLPDLSPVFSRHLSRFQDGFVKAGAGFGYTFPNDRRPWMRIDRILATDALRFVKFEVGTSAASDHLCVVADLQRAR
jgi:endonuclease/exonuclease/phosphatase (EEP) superfamily protein YafD